MYIAIYSTNPLLENEKSFINKRYSTREKALEFLRREFNKLGYTSFWYPHLYNTKTKEYEGFNEKDLTFILQSK